MSNTPPTVGASLGGSFERTPFWVRVSTSELQPRLRRRESTPACCLPLIGATGDHAFPGHTPSEQLLFGCFPYSSFTGKQCLTETR